MRDRPLVQALALLAGVGLLALGAAAFAEHGRHAIVLGLIRLGSGVAAILLARAPETARTALLGGGVLYLAVWLVGMAGVGSWIPVRAGDNWLHLLVGVGLVVLGSVSGGTVARPATAA